jgi:hypothetical protein
MIRGGVALEILLSFMEFGLFLALDMAGMAFQRRVCSAFHFIYHSGNTGEGVRSAIIAYKVETVQTVRKGIRKLHRRIINLLGAIPVVAAI